MKHQTPGRGSKKHLDEWLKKSDHDRIMITKLANASHLPHTKPLSLAASERMLRERLGPCAPALITMRRHAKAGHLDGCVAAEGEGSAETGLSRARYVPELLLAHYQSSAGTSSADKADDPPTQSPLPELPGGMEHLHRKFEAILQMQAETQAALALLTERVTSMGSQVRDLNAVRAVLMAKYDAASTAAMDRAERLEQENRLLRHSGDPNAQVLAKIQMGLQRVMERLSESH